MKTRPATCDRNMNYLDEKKAAICGSFCYTGDTRADIIKKIKKKKTQQLVIDREKLCDTRQDTLHCNECENIGLL